MKKLTILIIVMMFCAIDANAQGIVEMCLTNDFEEVQPINHSQNNSGFATTQQGLVSQKKTWPIGAKIMVKFMDKPSAKVFSKIKQYAEEWERYANIDFVFKKYDYGSGVPGMIRIGLMDGKGHWSVVGIDALSKNITHRTMNFDGFNDKTEESKFRRLVLHEFGHALGLTHEHKSPSKNICWDWQKVIKAYKKSENWDEERIRRNLERLSNEDVGNYTSFDSKSIMIYSINKDLTTCGFKVDGTNVLSYHDKQGIANLYPKTNSRNLKDNILNEYKLGAGWDNVQTFGNYGLQNFLFLLKSKTGTAAIYKLGKNGTLGSRTYNRKLTTGWTTARTFKIKSQNYVFLLKQTTGDVKVLKLNNNGTVGSEVFKKKWTSGWSDAQVYSHGNQNYLFLIKERTGDAHINKINLDGTIGVKTIDTKWTTGWSIAETFTVNYTPHLFLLKSKTGAVKIFKLNKNGTVGTRTLNKTWTKGWSSATFHAFNNQQYLMLLDSKTGRAKRFYITAGGTLGKLVSEEKFNTNWTSCQYYNQDKGNFLVTLKATDGLVKTFSLK